MESKPHAVCVPYPAQGHVNPMLKLAKLLHSRGFHVTFVYTEYYHSRILKARGPGSLDGLPSFRFEAIPDGLPPCGLETEQDHVALVRSIFEGRYLPHLRDLLARLDDSAAGPGGPPAVTFVVSDYLMGGALDVAGDLGLQRAALWTAGAASFLAFAHFERLVEMGIIPFKDESYKTNGELDKALDWMPGAEGIRLRDLPTNIRTTEANSFMLKFLISMMHQIKKASVVFSDTFDALEGDTIRSLSSSFPPLCAVGPMAPLLGALGGDGKAYKSITSSARRDDPRCLNWLGSFEPRSVVYVSFGSSTVLTNDQLAEFAWGIANCGQPFLWVVRPDSILGGSVSLPSGFSAETRERGMVVDWCDQERVLVHPSIGVFLTHCGWNSMVESIYSGVPMVCWPFMADQQTNCWYCCRKWGIGVEVDANVNRADVEERLKEAVAGEKGREMAAKAAEWKSLARQALLPTGGSSYNNLDKAVKMLLTKN